MSITALQDLAPSSPAGEIDWARIEALFAPCGLGELARTPQNPVFHGEGDVLTHTKLVCRALIATPAFQSLPEQQRQELFLAAILHDVGKARTTRRESGAWVSPHHAAVGSRIARELLWRDFGLCGTPEALRFRETVCALVRWHMLPAFLPNRDEPEREARRVAAIGELTPDFSWDLLCLLAEADVRGRLAADTEDCLTQVQLTRILAEEAGCLYGPYRFRDSFAKHAYLSGRKVQPDQTLYDDTWGEVILLSGLPGTGKDTWIDQNAPALPTISPDSIRRGINAAPTGNQAQVIHLAQERAKELLRDRQPFVWNATNITRELRQELVGLLERYGARVQIVYLETAWETELQRNAARGEKVPQAAIEAMLRKTEPPTPDEAQAVEWRCV